MDNDIVMIDTTAKGLQRELAASKQVEMPTPIHPKMQKPKQFEEDKQGAFKRQMERPSTSGANMYFKAAPRPVTSHGRGNQ